MPQGDQTPARQHSAAWSTDHPAKRRGARRGRIYELFVLGELRAGPHHGYLLHEILGKAVGPFRQISWGALYPLIHRLEQEGLIAPDVRSGRGEARGRGKEGQRHLYRITQAGRERFRELMLELGPYTADQPELFASKLGYFDYITPGQRQAILEHYRGFLQAERDYVWSQLNQVMTNTEIPESERMRIQWVNGLRLSKIKAEMTWVDAALASLSAGRE